MPPTDDELAERADSRASLPWIFVGLAGIFAFYLLALGPIVRWAPRSSYEGLRAVYAPVVWAHEHVPVVEPLLDAYVSLWDG